MYNVFFLRRRFCAKTRSSPGPILVPLCRWRVDVKIRKLLPAAYLPDGKDVKKKTTKIKTSVSDPKGLERKFFSFPLRPTGNSIREMSFGLISLLFFPSPSRYSSRVTTTTNLLRRRLFFSNN